MLDLAISGAEEPLTKKRPTAGVIRRGCAYGGRGPCGCDLPLALSPQPGGWWALGPVLFYLQIGQKAFSRFTHLKAVRARVLGTGWRKCLSGQSPVLSESPDLLAAFAQQRQPGCNCPV